MFCPRQSAAPAAFSPKRHTLYQKIRVEIKRLKPSKKEGSEEDSSRVVADWLTAALDFSAAVLL